MDTHCILRLHLRNPFSRLGVVASRLSTPSGRSLFAHIEASGLRLETTRPRVMYWLEGLLGALGHDPTARVVDELLLRARGAQNAEAWFNWALVRPWTGLVPDTRIHWVYAGEVSARALGGARSSAPTPLSSVLEELLEGVVVD